MNRILITGITGFLGSAMARHFIGEENSVCGVGSPRHQGPLSAEVAESSCEAIGSEGFRRFLESADADLIVHCAGSSSVGQSFENPDADFSGNVELTSQLLEAVRVSSRKSRVVFLSSAAVYGNPSKLPVDERAAIRPISPYGYHKRQAELLVEEYAKIHGLRTASVRIFSAYGPRLSKQVIWDLSQKIKGGGMVELHGDGTESRDFIHSSDVSRGVEIVGSKAPLEGEIYNLATGKEWPIRDVLGILLDEFGEDREIRFTGDIGEGVPRHWRADISKIRALGFEPQISLPEGLSDYARWFLETHG